MANLTIDERLALAKKLSSEGSEAQAQEVLLELLSAEPHHSAALFMLGGSYYCDEKFSESVVIFEQLVLMFPGDGKASTGLYNALWNLGRVTESLEEIKRFIQNADRVAERSTIETYLRIVETFSADEDQPSN